MTLISIIIPAYNQGNYLSLAIQSILDQSYQAFEIIVVDDGSTDDTATVVKTFSDTRLHYHYQLNAGLSAARNTGLRLARGRLISFLDSDDLFLPEKLTLLAGALKANPGWGIVMGEAILIDEEGKQLQHRIGHSLNNKTGLLLLGNPFHVGSVLVRREWLDQITHFDESLRACEDWDIWLRLGMAGCRFGWVDEPVSLYRVHQAQMTRDGERMRTAMLATLDKVFATGNLPESWKQQRSQAYALAHLRAAARAYHANDFKKAQQDLTRAVSLRPTLLHNNAQTIVDHLAGWACAPLSDDPVHYLRKVYNNLPDSLALLRERQRTDIGRLALELTYNAYQAGNLAQARIHLLQAIRYQPQLLTNRGILSILTRSWIAQLRKGNRLLSLENNEL